jgi:polyphosphate kinase
MNALNDQRMIQALYRASQAGVHVDLIVRGHSRLRPGFEGVSDNIRVISILGRFLEHTRVYYFAHDGAPEVYIGSADWMSRNLEDRVEAIIPVREAPLRDRIIDMLERALADERSAWELAADGRYVQRVPGDDEQKGLQEQLMEKAKHRPHHTQSN